ncbi:MAG: prenyltransferase [Gammaproteobacteria bacterium]|nr:prenyltransferase [Gammaproteobacteria bacterium]
MNQPPNISFIKPNSLSGLDHLGKFLGDIQLFSGAMPCNKDSSHDPWDHLEAIMGLATLGYKTEAMKGFTWMISNQNEDGSWYNLYYDQKPLELNKQTNYASYIAVAAWHFYLLNKDIDFLKNHWESIKKGILFSLSLQNFNGAIAWNIDKLGKVDDDYLLTGCSSIAKSLECAIAICQVLGHNSFEAEWKIAHTKLIKALENPLGIFDLKKDRSRFSMDSYYPILAGINKKNLVNSLIKNIKQSFWIQGLGIKCVIDEPWVTVAETCECSIAFKKIGEDQIALELLHNAIQIVDNNSIPYMGWQFHENIYWPEETPSWTSGACILAADANYGLTSASDLFVERQFKS